MKGLCTCCLQLTKITKHHIYPRQFFQKSPIVYLCKDCHKKLHKIYPRKKVKKKVYLQITRDFILKEV
jgi:uncharacterized protein YlaI